MEGDIFLLVEDALALVGAPDKLVPRRNGVGLHAARAGQHAVPQLLHRLLLRQVGKHGLGPACARHRRNALPRPLRQLAVAHANLPVGHRLLLNAVGRHVGKGGQVRTLKTQKSGALARKIVHHVVVAGQQRVLGHLGLGELDQVQQVTLPHHAHIRRTGVVCRFCHNTDKILVLRGSLNVKHLPRLQIHSPANQNICILIHVFIAWHGRFTLLCALVQSVFNSS